MVQSMTFRGVTHETEETPTISASPDLIITIPMKKPGMTTRVVPAFPLARPLVVVAHRARVVPKDSGSPIDPVSEQGPVKYDKKTHPVSC